MKTIHEQIEERRYMHPEVQIASAVEVAKSMCWQAEWGQMRNAPFSEHKSGSLCLRYVNGADQILIFLVRKNGDVVASLRPKPGIEITLRQDGQCEGFAPANQHEPDKVPLDVWVPLVAAYDIARDCEPMPS